MAASLFVGFGISATACGHVDEHVRSTPAGTKTVASAGSGRLEGDVDDDDIPQHTEGTRNDSDADLDNDSPALQNKGYRDSDDRAFVTWGKRADASDTRAVVALVKRYYQLGAEGDGAKACSLIHTLFAEAIPEDYGQPPGPPALRGTTCAVVMTKLFKQEQAHLASDSQSIRVTDVRVQGRQGRAFLGFAATPAAYIQIRLERHSWKIASTLGVTLP